MRYLKKVPNKLQFLIYPREKFGISMDLNGETGHDGNKTVLRRLVES